MKKAVYTVFLIDCLYILISSLSSLFLNNYTLYLIIKYLAFVLPLVALIFVVRRGKFERVRLLPDKKGALLTLPLVAPAILLVMGTSYLTALVMSLVTDGAQTVGNVSGGSEFLLHALIPSFFEELVFRLVPLVLLTIYRAGNYGEIPLLSATGQP